ncbi:MAG: MBL fold metallo-hydrolase [Candidatus Zixiibacteriota bacterium]|nr:MAG: MBL fold metallo-hydrolase [candidate division Zixibacteria bacterium]
MKRNALITLTVLIVLAALPCQAAEAVDITVTPLADHIYELSYDGGGYTVKVVASVGDDGLLLVDAGQKEYADQIKASLAALKDETPKIIISTHEHVEHVGGNAMYGSDPVIIGHTILRDRLRSGSYLFQEFSDDALPDLTFDDSLSIHFNGEEIKIIAYPGSHSDNDIIVWFSGSRVACVGAICNGFHFPSVDRSGDVLKYAEVAGRVIERLPDDAKIVPGHGEDCTMDDLRAFHDMLVKTTEVVRAGVAQGKDAATLQQEMVLKDWESYGGSYVSVDRWIRYLVDGLTSTGQKASVYEPMYYAIRDKGPMAAIEYYFELRATQPEDYDFRETNLAILGYMLYTNNRAQESIPFFERSNLEYPDGVYAELCHSYLGHAYNSIGNTEKSLENFKRALELNPDNTEAAEKIAELENN